MSRKVCDRIFVFMICLSLIGSQARAAEESTPVVRSPGVSQEALETLAEAQGRTLLSDFFDLKRPSDEATAKLTRHVERAQTAWLSGTVESARAIFKEIAKLTLEADWREPQREAIQYAMLRLAQSAGTATERAEWIERAVNAFPDLHPDSDSFPPPLIESFNSARTRILALAPTFRPYEHFPDHRYLLLNGKKFVISPDLKIRLPKAQFRITVLSDAYGSFSEIMTSSQLIVFRLAAPALASGTCSEPAGAELMKGVSGLSVMYSPDCLRIRTAQGWLAPGTTSLEPKQVPFPQNPEDPFPDHKSEAEVSSRTKAWIWAGLTVLAIGAGYLGYRELHRDGEWEFGF